MRKDKETAGQKEGALEKAVERWQKARGSRKFHIFFDELRPSITRMLRERILGRQQAGEITGYDTLLLSLGMDMSPALITINALLPQRLILLYTATARKGMEEILLPHIDKSVNRDQIEYLELDALQHDENFRNIRRLMESLAPGGKVIADITGGKKIISSFLALLAHNLGYDLCYMDALEYVENSSRPLPGTEVLYIQSSRDNRVISVSVGHEGLLIINYIPETGQLIYNLVQDGEAFRFDKMKISPSESKTIRERMALVSAGIDQNVLRNAPSGNELDQLSTLIRTMLLDPELDRILSHSSVHRMRLVLDPVLCGIPWETVLVRHFAIQAPVIRRMSRDQTMVHTAIRGDHHGLLVLFGSGEGVPGFAEARMNLERMLEKLKVKHRIVDAADRGTVRYELGHRRYNVILYMGHSEHSESIKGTGWKCMDGELFDCSSLEVLSQNPTDLVISNSCHSALSLPFNSHSIGYHVLRAGVRSFIGTRWFLEFKRSTLFLSVMLGQILRDRRAPLEAFQEAIDALRQKYGEDDPACYNYIFYD